MINNLNNILKRNGLGEVRRVGLEVRPHSVKTPGEVLDVVRDFGPAAGWLCVTDEVLTAEQAFDTAALTGRIILSGEIVSGSRSLHIRQDEAGWTVTNLERKESGDHILIEESLVSTKRPFLLKYETFWLESLDSFGLKQYRACASRFAGFERNGG